MATLMITPDQCPPKLVMPFLKLRDYYGWPINPSPHNRWADDEVTGVSGPLQIIDYPIGPPVAFRKH